MLTLRKVESPWFDSDLLLFYFFRGRCNFVLVLVREQLASM